MPACARSTHSAGADTPVGRKNEALREADIPVIVENHSSDDVVITIRNPGGQIRRLGTVAGNGRGRFTFSETFAAASRRLVLIAHPVGARSSYQSETFTVQNGQTAVWSLENGFARSTVSVY